MEDATDDTVAETLPRNARLIAAAPDLLEACQALTAAYGIGEWRLRSIDIARDLALEAVQKAVE